MICEFFRVKGTDGKKAVNYLCNEVNPVTKERRGTAPEVLKGDPEQTANLINSLDFKHKYTSGAISFEPEAKITPEMERDIIQGFEKTAFAGLRENQYDILWVRHSHAGSHEMHFLIPKVELESGKQLNVRPPGKGNQMLFDCWRDKVNHKYNLADPEDPERKRQSKLPDHEQKKIRMAERTGEMAPKDARVMLNDWAKAEVRAGRIKSQDEMIEAFKAEGYEVTRAGKDYMTVMAQEKRIRLKGDMYGKDFSGQTAERKLTKSEERGLLKNRIGERMALYEELLEKRSRDNEKRFQVSVEPEKEKRPQLLSYSEGLKLERKIEFLEIKEPKNDRIREDAFRFIKESRGRAEEQERRNRGLFSQVTEAGGRVTEFARDAIKGIEFSKEIRKGINGALQYTRRELAGFIDDLMGIPKAKRSLTLREGLAQFFEELTSFGKTRNKNKDYDIDF